MRHTPLYEKHMETAQKVINLKGVARPIEYSGHEEEHLATQQKVTICDVSHMGQLEFKGKDALKLVQKLITNDADSLSVGKAFYSVMCNEDGGVIDDFIGFILGKEYFLWVVNVTKTEEDLQWVLKYAAGMDVEVRNTTCETAMIAVQGPNSREVLQKITKTDLCQLEYMEVKETVIYVKGLEVPVVLSRAGYSGEIGYELCIPRAHAPHIWDELLLIGKPLGIMPHGVAARESLRIEAGLLLNGNDMNDNINPYEAGLGWIVKTNKDFIGKEALKKIKENGIRRKIVGFEIQGKETVRHGYPIFNQGKNIGYVTSGTIAFGEKKRSIGLGIVSLECSKKGTELQVDVKGIKCKAIIVGAPFKRLRVKDEPVVKTYSPSVLKFTDSHLWAYDEGDNVLTIGMSDFGQRDFGEILYINLPEEGTKIEKGSNLFWFDTYRKAVELKSPFSGQIVKVDKVLHDSPENINKYPYNYSGIVKIKVDNMDEFKKTLDFKDYDKHVAGLQSYSQWSTDLRTT